MSAPARSNEDQSHYPLAMGLTVMSAAYALGGISGGVFNPAVALGITVGHMVVWGDLWDLSVWKFARCCGRGIRFSGDEPVAGGVAYFGFS